MNTRNATPEDENLPGQEFRDRNGRGFAQFVAAFGHSGPLDERWNVRLIASTGSTNEDLARAAERGAPDRLVLVADHQTAGRGRLDRRWEAEPGANLLVSFLFRSVPDRPHQLTQAVALAAVDASRKITRASARPPDVSVKWPNDIVIEMRKLGGILATASTVRETRVLEDAEVSVPEHVVVGLGLNVGWSPEGAVDLSEFVADPHRDDVLIEVLTALDKFLVMPSKELHDRYRNDLSTIGRVVRVELPTGNLLEGRALGVGMDGRLEVLDACAMTHHIDVADIVHLRLAD